ncbi:MAG: hypothetical protein AcusKO_36760 [Acuticoccus sp.]
MERILIRMAMLLRRPPSKRKLIVIGAVMAFAVAVWGLEQFGLWPDWAGAEQMGRRGIGMGVRALQ